LVRTIAQACAPAQTLPQHVADTLNAIASNAAKHPAQTARHPGEYMKPSAGAAAPGGSVPRFVPQRALPAGEAYEAFIHRAQRVPTRDNWHDFFNGLVWQAMPRSKHALNRMQAAELARDGVRPKRGRLRDAATLFDESGALLVTQDRVLVDAWRARDWQRLFVARRGAWVQTRVLVFGHALLEKLLSPYKAITAQALWLDAPCDTAFGLLDARLAALLPEALAQREFSPLPLMGVPGWCADNATAAYYDDVRVFRSADRRLPSGSPAFDDR
jgi:hypothetical protein